MGAVLAPGDAAGAIGSVKPFFVQIHFPELVRSAKPAIHSTRSNQFFLHFSATHRLLELEILDDQIGFPPVFADGPFLRIIAPAPGDRPGTVNLLGVGEELTFKSTDLFIFLVKNTALGINKQGGFADVINRPPRGVVGDDLVDLFLK